MTTTLAIVTVTSTPFDDVHGPLQTVTYEVLDIQDDIDPGRHTTVTLQLSESDGLARTAPLGDVAPSISTLISEAQRSQSLFNGGDDPDGIITTSDAQSTATPFTLDASSTFSTATTSASTTRPTISSSTSSNGSAVPASASSATPTSVIGYSHQDRGLSSGAVAGLAIGCFFIGLMVAMIAAFLVVGKFAGKRKRPSHYDTAAAYQMKHASAMASETPIRKAPSVEVAPYAPGSAAAIVEDALPHPADDDALRSALISLRTQINNHVLSFYRTNPSQEQVPLDVLAAVITGSGLSAGEVQGLLQDHKTRTAAMRFVTAWVAMSRVAVSRVQGSEVGGSTFLPDQLASLHQVVSSQPGDEIRSASLSKWRTITAYLLSPDFDRLANDRSNGPLKTDDAVAAADSVLKTYAKGDTSDRLRNLEDIMRRAERLAFMLFAQPGEFRLDWDGAQQGLVVFPRLEQISDENGMRISGEHTVLQEDVVHL